jgi:hypothetical protein
MELTGDPLRVVVKGSRRHGALELPIVISQSDQDDDAAFTYSLYSKRDFNRVVVDDPVYVIMPEADRFKRHLPRPGMQILSRRSSIGWKR